MRVIIPCAGKATRWRNEAVCKHLVKLCGEPILHRTVRLLADLAPDVEPLIVVEDPSDTRYDIAGSQRVAARLGAAKGDIDKIASSRHLWDADDWTLILFGDVWWSLPAITTVVHYPRRADEWTAFLRFGPGGHGGEIFAFAFQPTDHARVDDAIEQLDGLKGVRGGWGLYRILSGGDPLEHVDRGHHTVINDWSEDLDGRRDWEKWCWRWAMATDAERSAQVGT